MITNAALRSGFYLAFGDVKLNKGSAAITIPSHARLFPLCSALAIKNL